MKKKIVFDKLDMKKKIAFDKYNKIRHKWEIDPTTKFDGEKKNDKSFQRRQTRQNLTNLHGSFSEEDLENLENLEFEDLQ